MLFNDALNSTIGEKCRFRNTMLMYNLVLRVYDGKKTDVGLYC